MMFHCFNLYRKMLETISNLYHLDSINIQKTTMNLDVLYAVMALSSFCYELLMKYFSHSRHVLCFAGEDACIGTRPWKVSPPNDAVFMEPPSLEQLPTIWRLQK
jgi:hypothetical protein